MCEVIIWTHRSNFSNFYSNEELKKLSEGQHEILRMLSDMKDQNDNPAIEDEELDGGLITLINSLPLDTMTQFDKLDDAMNWSPDE